MPVSAGSFQRIYDPSVGEKEKWYINDHTIIRGHDGLWHMFGITHAEPADPEREVKFAHATSPVLTQPQWTKQPFALTAERRHHEVLLWAPYVFEHDGIYHMFYCAGDPNHARYRIHQATSRDLWHWTRVAANPMVVDGYDARDPFITRIAGRWVLYYTANTTAQGGHHIVAYRTSQDLMNWGKRHVAYESPEVGTWGGPTESPFVVQRGEFHYLFTGPAGKYEATNVYRSRDPFHFQDSQLVGQIPAHAAEVVQDLDGTWYITHAGWGQQGLWLAPLHW
ncbi:MAG: glycosyl hydrolase family 32 [Deltaproteobacteria bacterium]|nr:glycosyl hydrolase family 32 [Deltaproteobacteria bacterium]